MNVGRLSFGFAADLDSSSLIWSWYDLAPVSSILYQPSTVSSRFDESMVIVCAAAWLASSFKPVGYTDSMLVSYYPSLNLTPERSVSKVSAN